MNLCDHSDGELMDGVARLVGVHRRVTAKLVAYLAEIEERRLHLVAGYSSMFDFCRKKLEMSEGEAFRRIVAARLARRFPTVLSMVASGKVNLSTLVLVREHLTSDNHVELLDAVSSKSKAEAERVLATRFPQPDAPTRIRRDRVSSLSETRYRVELTVSTALREKLELARDLMSHANPTRELAVVIERAVDLLLEDLEKQKLAKSKRQSSAGGTDPTTEPTELPKGRSAPGVTRIPRAVRRRVFERDGLQCTFVAADRHRCDGRSFLELDHVKPRALGGRDEVENLRVRCRAHNQLWAEQAFGKELVEQCRHFRQRKLAIRNASSSGSEQEREPHCRSEGLPSLVLVEKLRSAMRRMGFRENDALHAIKAMLSAHGESISVERALRETILIATAA
jgi:hypothetical protein